MPRKYFTNIFLWYFTVMKCTNRVGIDPDKSKHAIALIYAKEFKNSHECVYTYPT